MSPTTVIFMYSILIYVCFIFSAVSELMEALETNMTEITRTLQNLVASSTESILSSINMTYLQNSVCILFILSVLTVEVLILCIEITSV